MMYYKSGKTTNSPENIGLVSATNTCNPKNFGLYQRSCDVTILQQNENN